MTYTEKELDQFLHGISLSLLSKKSAQHWRYDEETAKEIEWLEALERKVRADKADRKTENSSGKPNNCEKDCFLCKWLGDVDVCGRCRNRNLFAEADTEPTSSKMEQVDKDINVRSKDEPTTQTETQNSNLTFEKRTMRDCYNCKKYETEGECIECKYEPKDEPQTERSACDTCQWYNSGIPCGVEPSVCKREVEDEPQTERSE